MNTKGWAGDIQCDDNPSSICGLEISFVSADIQDIDIKLIPVNQFCNINNPGILQKRCYIKCKPGVKMKLHSIHQSA